MIEKGHKTPISQFCFNPLNLVSFLNFVSLFCRRENETKMSGDNIQTHSFTSMKLPQENDKRVFDKDWVVLEKVDRI